MKLSFNFHLTSFNFHYVVFCFVWQVKYFHLTSFLFLTLSGPFIWFFWEKSPVSQWLEVGVEGDCKGWVITCTWHGTSYTYTSIKHIYIYNIQKTTVQKDLQQEMHYEKDLLLCGFQIFWFQLSFQSSFPSPTPLCPRERESIPDPLASAQIFKFS